MIPFFRKIRKQFAEDNKPAKYMRYAIGEIFLVVLGILIALQINNWNEDRKNRIFEKKMLHEIRSALINDIDFFNKLITRSERIESCTQKVINYFDAESVDVDSLIGYVDCSRMGILFNYNSGPFDAIISNGTDKITNDSLRKELINFYGFRLPTIKRLIDFEKGGGTSGEFEDFFKAIKIQRPDGSVEIKYSIKNDSLLHDPDFLEYMDGKQKVIKRGKVRVNAALKSSNKILLLLNEELD